MDKNEINKLWETMNSDNESDSFFIGVGNELLIKKYSSPESFSDQIFDDSGKLEIPIINDLSEFETEKIDINSIETYHKLFIKGKKESYDMFQYLDIKSKNTIGVVNEENLIINEHDLYLIKELVKINKDYYAILNLSKLYAYLDMGIYEVMFKQKDNCPICKVIDGHIFDLNEVINLICSNNGVTHKYCSCEFLPVIRREQTYGGIDKFLNEDLDVCNKNIINMPVEMKNELCDLICKLPNDIIEFLNINEYLFDNNINDFGVVSIENEEGILFIHNSYINNKGPIDFVKALLDNNNNIDRVDLSELKGGEEFYYKGKKVIKLNNKYWDINSGKEVNILV